MTLALLESWQGTPKEGIALSFGTRLLLSQNYGYNMKLAIGLAGWTLRGSAGSSDGTQANVTGAMDGVDRLLNPAAFVWDTAGVKHWWMDWESPVGMLPNSATIRLGIQGSTGSTNDHKVNGYISTAVPSGGSATADPTVVSTTSKSWANIQTVHAANANSHCRYTYSASGNFCFWGNVDNSGLSNHGLGWWTGIKSTTLTDNYCGLGLMGFSESAPGWLSLSTLQNSLNTASFKPDGTRVTSGGIGFLYGPTGDMMVSFDSNGSSIDSTYPATSAPLVAQDSGWRAIRGNLKDFLLGPDNASVVQGQTIPNSSTPLFHLLGRGWVAAQGLNGVIVY